MVLWTFVLKHCTEMLKIVHGPSSLNILSVRARQTVKFKKLAGIHSLTVAYQSKINLAYFKAHLIYCHEICSPRKLIFKKN